MESCGRQEGNEKSGGVASCRFPFGPAPKRVNRVNGSEHSAYCKTEPVTCGFRFGFYMIVTGYRPAQSLQRPINRILPELVKGRLYEGNE